MTLIRLAALWGSCLAIAAAAAPGAKAAAISNVTQAFVRFHVSEGLFAPPSPNLGVQIAGFPYQGNLRFRHRKNTTCNVGYADGHVGQFTGKFKPDGRPIAHDAIRKSFMVKWPKGEGIAPDPSLPH